MSLQKARATLEEGITLIDKSPVIASLKLYKAAEEAVRAIATTQLRDGNMDFGMAVTMLTKRYGEFIAVCWNAATTLYDLGYMEGKLESRRVKKLAQHVENLVRFAERLLSPTSSR
ncbi:MAG: PaREP1 family protein [Pyrobaculum sp.]